MNDILKPESIVKQAQKGSIIADSVTAADGGRRAARLGVLLDAADKQESEIKHARQTAKDYSKQEKKVKAIRTLETRVQRMQDINAERVKLDERLQESARRGRAGG